VLPRVLIWGDCVGETEEYSGDVRRPLHSVVAGPRCRSLYGTQLTPQTCPPPFYRGPRPPTPLTPDLLVVPRCRRTPLPDWRWLVASRIMENRANHCIRGANLGCLMIFQFV